MTRTDSNHPIARYIEAIEAGTTESGDEVHMAAQAYADSLDSTVSLEMEAYRAGEE